MSASENPRDTILDHALRLAPFDGWTDATLRIAVRKAGLPPGAANLYFPDGALGLLRYWSDQSVAHVESEIAARGLTNMRIRDRVTEGILIAMEAIGPHEAAMRRGLSRLTLPDAVGQGPAQLWRMADAIWHGIGDTSTDFNHYSKRTILSGILSASVIAWLNDKSPDKAEARAFIDRRIDGVMQFEKVKARARTVRKEIEERVPNPAELLGTLRYGRTSGRDSGMRRFGSNIFGRASTKSRRRRTR